MPNLLMAPKQPFLEVSPYFNHRISMDTKGQISSSSDGNSYVHVIVDLHTMLSSILHPKMMSQIHSQYYLITGLLNLAFQIFY